MNVVFFIRFVLIFFIYMGNIFLLEASGLEKKIIYDTTGYLNKNQINESFFIPMKILYEDKLLPNGPDAQIDTEYLIRLAHSLPRTSVPYILDIESWKTGFNLSDNTVGSNIDKYILVIKTLKKERPDLKFGYFGIIPSMSALGPGVPTKIMLAQLEHSFMLTEKLSKYVDIICPELYTYWNDPVIWERHARFAIQFARRYGKPVYPFVWSEFMDTTTMVGQFLPRSYWKRQIEFLYKNSNGIIVWGGPNFNTHQKREWDENAPWWIETKSLILKNKQLAGTPVKTDKSELNRAKSSSEINAPKKNEVPMKMILAPQKEEGVKPLVKRIRIIKE